MQIAARCHSESALQSLAAKSVRDPQHPGELKVDICNACHPFYTGKLKYVDTAGRIEKFQRKFSNTGYASLQRGKKKPVEAPAEAETI